MVDTRLSAMHDMRFRRTAEFLLEQAIRAADEYEYPPYHAFAIPCDTYCSARFPKIRNEAYPLGIPQDQLSQKDLVKLRDSNKVTSNSYWLMEKLSDRGWPVSLENPRNSLITRTRSHRRWAARSGAAMAVTDFCQFGTEFRKRTQIWHTPHFLGGIERRCNHVHTTTLSTWNNSAAQVRTKGKGEYPRALCAEWARLFTEWQRR